MKQENSRFRFLIWIFPALVAAAIFRFSGQPGDDSSQLSSGLIIAVLDGLKKLGLLGGMDTEQMLDMLSLPIRKAAHVTEYILLCTSFLTASCVSGFRKKRWIVLSFLFTFLYACTDEFHQTFVPGRAGRFTDVLIDCAGAFVLCVAVAAVRIQREKRQNRNLYE